MMTVLMVLIGGGLTIVAVGLGLNTNKGIALLASGILIITVTMMLEYVG